METPVNEMLNGTEGVITHWVNQPNYVGNTLKKDNDLLVMINKNGIETIHPYLDKRYLHWAKVEVSPSKDESLVSEHCSNANMITNSELPSWMADLY